MSNQMGSRAVSGPSKVDVQKNVQKPQMNKKNEGNSMPDTNKKSRHCGAALSASFADAQHVKADPEIVAPHRAMASKSRQVQVSKAAIAGQFALYSMPKDPEKPKPVRVSIELVESPIRYATPKQMVARYNIQKMRDMFIPYEHTWQGREKQVWREWERAQDILKARQKCEDACRNAPPMQSLLAKRDLLRQRLRGVKP